MEFNISIQEGGEDLLITPVAYNHVDDKVLYYRSSEFPPYNSILTDISSFYFGGSNFGWKLLLYPKVLIYHCYFDFKGYLSSRWNKLYYLYLKKFCTVLKYIWEQPRLNIWWNLRNFDLFWNSLHCVQGIEMFNGQFWVNHQIQIEDPDGYCDEVYIMPSQKYLEARVNQYIDEFELVKGDLEKYSQGNPRNVYFDRSCETIKLFNEWKQKMLDKGYRVGYIAELET